MKKINKKELIELLESNMLQEDKDKLQNTSIQKILENFIDTLELTIAQQLQEGNEVVLKGFAKFIMYRRNKTKLGLLTVKKESADVCKCRISPSYTKRILKRRT